MKLLYLIFFLFTVIVSCVQKDRVTNDLELIVLDIRSQQKQIIEIPKMEKLSSHKDTLTGENIFNNGYAINEAVDKKTGRKGNYILASSYFKDSDGNRWHLAFYVNNGKKGYAEIIVLLNNNIGIKIPEYHFYFKGTYEDIFNYQSEIFTIINEDATKNQSQFSLWVKIKE